RPPLIPPLPYTTPFRSLRRRRGGRDPPQALIHPAVPAVELLTAGTGLLAFGSGPVYGSKEETQLPRWEMGETDNYGHSRRLTIIQRPRLTSLLDATSSRIIMLVAPAGYGKTTLTRQWMSARAHAWYRGTIAASDVAALALGIA